MIAQGAGIAEALIDRGYARRGAGDGERPPLRPLPPFLRPAVIYADKVVPKKGNWMYEDGIAWDMKRSVVRNRG